MTRDVRMRGFRQRTDVNVVLDLLNQRIQPLNDIEVSLDDAMNYVLAEDVVADVSIPPFPRAAMDGYALKGEQTFGASDYNPLELAVIGDCFPGQGFDGTIENNQAIRIMTGAPVPAGADAVLMAEYAEEVKEGEQRKVRITEAVAPGKNVGQIGEDIKAGTVVLKKGRHLRPQDLGVLASIGATPLKVHRRPRVLILITGNELLPCGSRPTGYQIVDSNSIMLTALIQRDGGSVEMPPILKDDYAVLHEQVQNADADVILISGGSSVGQEDHAPRVIADLGELPVHGVALRPASPAGVGFVGERVVFLMPGNPVSCLCAYDLFAGPALRRLAGRSSGIVMPAPLKGSQTTADDGDGPYRTQVIPLARKISSMVGRVDYVRVRVEDHQVEPLATSGASILSSTTRADGFVLVPGDSEGYAPGEQVRVYFYS